MHNNNSLTQKGGDRDPDSILLAEAEALYGDGYYGALQEPSEKQQLFEFLSALRKRWLLIACITILGTSLVIIYEAQKPDYYTADVRIQVNNEMNPAAGSNSPSSIVLSSGNDPVYFTTQLQILEGSGLLRRVVKLMDLENNAAFFRPGKDKETTVWQNVMRMFGMYEPPPGELANAETNSSKRLSLKTDSALELDSQAELLAPYVGYIKSNLDVTPVKDSRTSKQETRLIEVEYTHHDPQMAAKVVNSIADIYVLQNLENKVAFNANASEFLQKRVAELQAQIRSGEERLINYAKNNQIISLDSSQNTVVQRLADLNAKLGQAENDRITAEAAYRSAMQNPMRSATAESQDARTSGLESQLVTLRQSLEQLKVEYTDEWPEVKQVQRQIAAIEKELQTNRKRSTDSQVAGLEQALREASNRENELRRNFDIQRSMVLNQNEAAINYRIIQQEIDTNKSLLDNLLQRSRETEVVLNGTPNNVHIIDRALIPRSPTGPQRTKNVLMAFVASLMGGIGLVFALNWLDDTVRATDDFERQLGMPVLGAIPGTQSGFASRLIPAKFMHNSSNGNGHKNYQPEAFQKPLISEAFHQLRTSLLLSTAGGAPKTILISSGQPTEGKTLTSLNLARSLAQLGERVLLIDADLRCPKMHAINNVSNKSGLSNLLTIKGAEHEIIDGTISKSIEPNLDLLTSGPIVPNPANLFSSIEMQSLLEHLSSMYSYIIIDSPPILYFADSIILATNVDAVVLIARANLSSRDVLKRAKKKLHDVRANVVGIVVNDIPLDSYEYHNNVYYRQLEQAETSGDAGSVLHLD